MGGQMCRVILRFLRFFLRFFELGFVDKTWSAGVVQVMLLDRERRLLVTVQRAVSYPSYVWFLGCMRLEVYCDSVEIACHYVATCALIQACCLGFYGAAVHQLGSNLWDWGVL